MTSYRATAGVSAAEAEYFQKFGHANHVSCALLETVDITGKAVFDVGAGSDPRLAQEVVRRKGHYIAVDLREDAIKKLQEQLTQLGVVSHSFVADVTKLLAKNRVYDFSHMRMVLRHLGSAKEQAVREVLRVTKSTAFFAELSWTNLVQQNSNPLLAEFVDLNLQFMRKVNVDPSMGESLESLVASASDDNWGIATRIFSLDEGPYSQDLVNLGRMVAGIAEGRQETAHFSVQLRLLAEQIEASPFNFTPPDFYTVMATRI